MIEVNINNMTLKDAIDARRSRRKYLTTPIASDAAVKLQRLIAEYNQKANLRMELVLDYGNAFNGLCKINLSTFYSDGFYVIITLKKMIKSSVDVI